MASKKKLITSGALLALSFISALGLSFFSKYYAPSLEMTPPKLKLITHPRGLGVFPSDIRLTIQDQHSGLAEFRAWIEQRSKRIDLAELSSFEGKEDTKGIQLELPSASSGLEEGAATLFLEVVDKSVWPNATLKSDPLVVDFTLPEISFIYGPRTLKEGRAGLFFYSVYERNLNSGFSGIKLDSSHVFHGFPAHYLDKSFDGEDIYVALVTIPPGFASKKPRLRIFAEDDVGNASSTALPLTIEKGEFALKEVKMKRPDFNRLAEQSFTTYSSLLRGFNIEEDFSSLDDERREEYVLRKFPNLSSRLVGNRMKLCRPDHYWKEPFVRQPTKTIRRFGEMRTYRIDEKTIKSTPSDGVMLLLPRGHEEVIAVAPGIVSAVDSFGLYGRGVIIDHGVCLQTFYGGLSHASITQGSFVKAGQVIGVASEQQGKSNHSFHLEVRLSGHPVDPLPWWDQRWFRRSVNGALIAARRSRPSLSALP